MTINHNCLVLILLYHKSEQNFFRLPPNLPFTEEVSWFPTFLIILRCSNIIEYQEESRKFPQQLLEQQVFASCKLAGSCTSDSNWSLTNGTIIAAAWQRLDSQVLAQGAMLLVIISQTLQTRFYFRPPYKVPYQAPVRQVAKGQFGTEHGEINRTSPELLLKC